jgi:hypothetical protein
MSGQSIIKRLIRRAAKLYPAPWRDRYGEEFEALLDDAGNHGRIACNVFAGAILMHIKRWQKAGIAALLATLALFAASWWVGQRPYITPGTHQVFRMDTTLGAMLEFLVLFLLLLAASMRIPRAGRVFAGIAGGYLAAVILVSLLTPRTIVSIGDSYCWDLWCLGIQNVKVTPEGPTALYTAEVSLSTDSTNVQQLRADPGGKQFFYVTDEQGHRFPIQSPSLPAADITIKPGESVKSSLTFIAPANARRLYLNGDVSAPPWVSLYFGSDLNPFHRRTLLRVL